jgi:hypothetical protein
MNNALNSIIIQISDLYRSKHVEDKFIYKKWLNVTKKFIYRKINSKNKSHMNANWKIRWTQH